MSEAAKDTRVVMYRANSEPHTDGFEAREFASADDVPKGEGWVDHPDKAHSDKKKGKPHDRKKAVEAESDD